MDLDQNGPIPTRGYDHVVCPECGSEFQPRITHCIDCGTETVPPGAVEEATVRPLEDREETVHIRTDDIQWIKGLKALLEQRGIACQVVAAGSPPVNSRFQIYVSRDDAPRAFELDHELLRERLGEEEDEMSGNPLEFPPGLCASCHARLPAGAVECPECGLIVAFNNLEIVQELYEAFKAQERDHILEMFDPDIEWIQNEGFPGGGVYTGAETVLNEVFARFAAEWETWQADVGRWLDAGDSIVALGAYRGTHRRTGRSMTAAFAHVYWLRDGRVVRFEQYADTAKVAEACTND